MLKFLIESTSSPHSSILIPILSSAEISTIPPLTLNCPLPSIKSHLEYPIFTRLFLMSSKLWMSPTLNSNMFLYNAFFDGNFCISASIVVTTIKFFFSFILFSVSILSYGRSLLSAT